MPPRRTQRRRVQRAQLLEKPKAGAQQKAKQQDLCIFCLRPESKEVFGEMLSTSKFHVHYFCLLFSSGLHQGGDETEPLRGFSEASVMAEHRRGAKLKCSYCKNRYATVGCCLKMCKKMFHVSCAAANQCLLQFYGDFRAYCPDHRPRQRMTPKDQGKVTCLYCTCDFDPEPSTEVLVTPCCKHSFHKKCLQKQASNAGIHFFKCGTCLNKDAFQKEMLDHGIYIPEQDASWEQEQGAYEELLYQYGQCDAPRCRCPMGREVSVSDSDEWKVVVCSVCGSRGVHRKCGNLSPSTVQENSWVCTFCRQVISSIGKLNSGDQVLAPLVRKGESKTGTSNAAGEASSAATDKSTSSSNQSAETAEPKEDSRVRRLRKRKTAASPEARTPKRRCRRHASSTSFRESEPRDHEADLPTMLSESSEEVRRPKHSSKPKKRKANRSAVAYKSTEDEAQMQSISSKIDVGGASNDRSLVLTNLRYEAGNKPSTSTSAGTSSLGGGEGEAMITCRNGKLCAMVKPRCSTDAFAKATVETVTAAVTTSGGNLVLASPEKAARPPATRMLQLLPPSAGATFRKPKPKPTPKKSTGVQLSLLSYLKQCMQHGSTSGN